MSQTRKNQWSDMTLAERFWTHVNKNGPIVRPELGPCWEWTGARVQGRYGNIRDAEGKSALAHRVAWFLETGRWPVPYCLHKCDNVLCVRFFHLFEGNQQNNMDDMISKGRLGPRGLLRGEQITNSKLTQVFVDEIRKRYATGRYTHRELAHTYEVSVGNIGCITRGETWAK